MLEKVRNINAQIKVAGWTGNSILHYIVKNSCNNPESGWVELLEEVLSKYSNGASGLQIKLNIKDGNGRAPLYVAYELGSLDVINVLLKYGADPNAHDRGYTLLYCALKKDKIDIAKVLPEHRAKAEELGYHTILKYNKSAVEVLLPCLSDETKKLMLCSIAMNSSVEADHDIELVTLLLKAGTNANCFIQYADPKKKGKLVKLCNEYKKNAINNNHIYNSEVRWAVIVPELLFGAIGATLAAMGIIPEIAAIGMIATVVLSGIVGAIVGGVAGYLVDVTINQCCNVQAKQQATNT